MSDRVTVSRNAQYRDCQSGEHTINHAARQKEPFTAYNLLPGFTDIYNIDSSTQALHLFQIKK